MLRITQANSADNLLRNKVVASFEVIREGPNSGSFKLLFHDGDFIIFHGGRNGDKNAEPWFELYYDPPYHKDELNS